MNGSWLVWVVGLTLIGCILIGGVNAMLTGVR